MRRSWQKRVLRVVLLILAISLLAGCGNFRDRALEAQSNIDDAVQRAEIAEAAAARNASLIIDLQHRIDALEAALATLQDDQQPE